MAFTAATNFTMRAASAVVRSAPTASLGRAACVQNRSMWTTGSIVSRFDEIVGVPSSVPSTHSSAASQQIRFRSRAGVPSWRRKAARRENAQEIREAVKFAARWDPLRSARTGVLRTLGKMGWPVNKNETITEGVKAFATLKHMYLVIDVVPEDSYLPGTHVLKPEVQSHYDMIRAKGWKVVLVNQRAWNKVALKSRTETNGESRAYARARFLINLVTDQAPFETRRDAELVSTNDYGVYDKMKKAAAKHGSQYGIAGIVRGKGRVRMRIRRSRS